MTKTYKCKWCGKGGFKTPVAVAAHTAHCPKYVKKRKPGWKPGLKNKINSSNLVYIPMAIALDFSNNTFNMVSMNELPKI
jgi:hypothetical protein